MSIGMQGLTTTQLLKRTLLQNRQMSTQLKASQKYATFQDQIRGRNTIQKLRIKLFIY